jgi:hypothetical protein
MSMCNESMECEPLRMSRGIDYGDRFSVFRFFPFFFFFVFLLLSFFVLRAPFVDTQNGCPPIKTQQQIPDLDELS